MALVHRGIAAAALGIVSLAIHLRAGGAPARQSGAGVQPPAPQGVEARAVAYLAAEVPRWRREHPCYSCHNNGDAARALIAASSRGYRARDDATAGRRELRAADLDYRVGAAGAAGIVKGITIDFGFGLLSTVSKLSTSTARPI